ncbi:MAG TPA: PQQ-binding-like beta-propeller repeat protein [Steroidobacteraceae bacterium]|nr:PQQ-binding-like beta-propeller repeat protein [Steroidobacteraceae bacterium]
MIRQSHVRIAGLLMLNAVMLGVAQAQSAAVKAQGQAVFKRVCAVCHLSLVPTAGKAPATADARAVPVELLHRYAPEAILTALTTGKMQAQGSTLTDAERKAVAQFITGRPFGPVQLAAVTAGKLCAQQVPMSDPATMPRWSGWGNSLENTRFQDKAAGGLSAADLPHLKLKWAFGYANVPAARTQPAVAGGRLFVASDNGGVYALDPATGCTYWMFKAPAGVPTALSVAPYHGADGKPGNVVLFGDRQANAYAVDAQTGKQVWTTKIDTHPSAAITGAPAPYEGRVYIPIQGVGEEGQGIHATKGCCTLRGSVTALDIDTGKVLWKTYTVPQPQPRGKSAAGLPMFGPSGVGIWSSPTIDAKRKLIYVATGNAYTDPPQHTSDAVLALDMVTGAIKWVSQVLPNDVWAMGCAATNNPNTGCPATLGPDYDFSASPALAHLPGRDLLVLPQKSGMAYAMDPDQQGKVVWQYRVGKGSGLGGMWGGAIAGDRVFIGTADLLTETPGGVHALNLKDGSLAWAAPRPQALCAGQVGCSTGQGAAVTAIPGAILSSGMDGGLRAYSTKTGKVIWLFNTSRSFKTVNDVKASGGSMDGPGPVVAGGMLFVNSGNGSLVGLPGNILLAFGLE